MERLLQSVDVDHVVGAPCDGRGGETALQRLMEMVEGRRLRRLTETVEGQKEQRLRQT